MSLRESRRKGLPSRPRRHSQGPQAGRAEHPRLAARLGAKALSGIFIYNPNISDEVDKQINDTMRAAEQIDEWAKVEKQLIDGAGFRSILRVAGEKM